MNKKNLSVVMAGAMLATSVAPVLADTTTTQTDYEVNGSNRGLLIKELRELINSKTFANVKENNISGDEDLAGKSVYYVKGIFPAGKVAMASTVIDANFANVKAAIESLSAEYNIETPELTQAFFSEVVSDSNSGKKFVTVASNGLYELQMAMTGITANSSTASVKVITNSSVIDGNNEAIFDNDNIPTLEETIQNAPTGTKFEIYDRGHREENGKYFATTDKEIAGKFDEKSLKAEYEAWKAYNKETGNGTQDYPAVEKMEYKNGVLKVYTRTFKGSNKTDQVIYTYEAGSDYVDFRVAVDADGNELVKDAEGKYVTSEDIAGFKVWTGHPDYVAEGANIPEEHLYTVTISNVDKEYNVTLPELYDGLFLTEDGQELLETLKTYDSNASKGWTVSDINAGEIDSKGSGLYSLTIKLEKPVPGTNDKVNTLTSNIVITSNNKAQLELFADGLEKQPADAGVSRKFPVQVLAGDNRYETAVKVAKENADITTVAENGNIVLVNGNSLVDGLAAAPLAASVINDGNQGTPSGNLAAPILLTSGNSLDSTTKDYIKEVIGQQKVMNLDKVTIYLVGGTSVISKSLENELKDMGLRVVRAGGADREATSLAVAELMNENEVSGSINKDNAFLVGANGEADAMSIAPVAAATGTPIIVESVHGISEDTIEYLQGYKLDGSKDVTIIGGENSVSAATENALEDQKIDTDRIFGSNRKETNAKVIDAYYGLNGNVNGVAVNPGHKFDNVVVSKDGMNNKSELIDALTATSLAVRDNAPIVLATNSLTNSQIEVLEDNASRDGLYVYQVGIGVARDVIQTIANRVGLAK